MGACFGSVIVIDIGKNESIELVLWDEKVPGTIFGPIDIFSLGTCDGTKLVPSDWAVDGKFEVLLLGDSLGSLYGIEVGGT